MRPTRTMTRPARIRRHLARVLLPRALIACASLLVTACTALPAADEFVKSAAPSAADPLPAVRDGRSRYRQIYCELAGAQFATGLGPARCEDALWRLADEPRGAPVAMPQIAPDLHVLVVGGAFSDCRSPPAIAFETAIERLGVQGMRIRAIPVSGRSGPQSNARLIAEAVGAEDVGPDQRVVLVGYSKGAVDVLQFLVDFPGLRPRIAAVVSVAGAIRGSPLAERGEWFYRAFLEESFAGMCDPGDGQVMESLRPAVRDAWLEAHPLPSDVRYYSLVAFPTAEHLGRGLAVTWKMLARYDRRNDGQVVAGDAVIPGSTLLGYVNADHWDVALEPDRQVPVLSTRPTKRVLPRAELLEAALRLLSDDLGRAAVPVP